MCKVLDGSTENSTPAATPGMNKKEAVVSPSSSSAVRSPLRLLLSLESFGSGKKMDEDETTTSSSSSNLSMKDNSSSRSDDTPPDFTSFFFTGSVVVLFLVFTEFAAKQCLEKMQHLHPILLDETNRLILARHLGVDAVSCWVCAYLGWTSRHLHAPVYQALKHAIQSRLGGGSSSSTTKPGAVLDSPYMPAAGHLQRIFTYQPGGFRIGLFFFFYQVKNLYDTIMWNDGPEFIFHHIFSMLTAWGAMYPGCGHLYVVFFMGLSEISTCVLVVLANFDDQFGVKGLGDALPMAKVVIGAVFAVSFIVCRCILWPIFAYFFCRDVLLALNAEHRDERTKARSGWMKFFLVSLSGLSVLQILWLGQIVLQGKEELQKVGLL